MNNLPIVLQEGGSNPPVLPENMLAQYNSVAEQMVQGFQGSFNRIKVGKLDFGLSEGGVTRRVENGNVIGVCLGMASTDYCSWYEKTYEPGQEPEVPDLVWLWSDRNQFPAALPAQWQQKKNRQNQDRWDFRIARRSVWALVQPSPATGQFYLNVESPFIFDITSASLYGKSDTQMNWYKWAGLIQLCNRFSQPPNFICSPAMFLTRIRIDPTSTVSGVVYFEPMMSQNGTPMYLDSNTFTQVVEVMQSQTVRDMLQVREILEWPKTNVSGVQNTAQPTIQPPSMSMTTPQSQSQLAQPVPTTEAPKAQEVPPMQTATSVAQPAQGQQTFAAMQQPAQQQFVQPTQSVAASPAAQPTQTAQNDPETQSRLTAAQAILNQGAAAPSAPAGAAQAKPATAAAQPDAAAPNNVNDTTADAIRAFSSVLA